MQQKTRESGFFVDAFQKLFQLFNRILIKIDGGTCQQSTIS